MKNFIKKEKGVTMVALVITVIILLILANVLIYNAADSIYIKKLTNLYSDIELLREKVKEYYNEYGEIPAKIEYTNITNLEKANILSQNNDIGKFYIIDLESMKGITLNYGRDYEKAKNNEDGVNKYEDIYIINENSHNIFYVKGVEISNKDKTTMYYTDYTEPDETITDLRYVKGIQIPEGYYYIGENNEKEIVISNNKNEEIEEGSQTQYIWKEQISNIDKKPDEIRFIAEQTEENFIKSVNIYKGYFINKNTNNVVYIKINEEEWTETYTKESVYTDEYGDKVTIPQGFKVSMSETMNKVKTGLVVKDENNNEWVWIQIPSNVFATAENSIDYENIKKDLIDYAKDYRNGSSSQNYKWADEWYEGCGLTKEEYERTYQNILSSIFNYNGFWISRYEIGDETATNNNYTTRTTNTGIAGTPVSKKDQIPYNYITVAQAQKLSEKLSTNSKTSSIIFGIQWDLVCKYLEVNANLTYENIATNSTNWGNYSNSKIKLTSGKFNISPNITTSIWTDFSQYTSGDKIFTTGASENTRKNNIYDFAGNLAELTLEHSGEIEKPCSQRAGDFTKDGSNNPVADRSSLTSELLNPYIGFRAVLY